MGHQSHIKAERRESRLTKGRALDILSELHRDIERFSGESPRRCWEYLVTIMAHESGINSLFDGTVHQGDSIVPTYDRLLEKGVGEKIKDYFITLDDEVQAAKNGNMAIQDPLGRVLELAEGCNPNHGQYFTPVTVVHAMNEMTLHDEKESSGRPTRGLDPCCGTGRFAMDALVYRDNLVMFNVEIDHWLARAALVNFRYMSRWTTLKRQDPLKIFTDESEWQLRESGLYLKEENKYENVIILGGRAWIIHADSLVVDLLEPLNWRWSWMWDPPPWEKVMKVSGFDGTYEEWIKAAPRKDIEQRLEARKPSKTRYDFSLDERTIRPATDMGRQRMEL